ncbi:MAG: 7-cyano-7-deazaguanine synthase QueC [Candidatus Omnitrophota bacterium]|jgi:7-cyano-7-deazaguanine synthase
MASKKAVVLLSGGLDSAVTLYAAKRKKYNCLCITFDYGQRLRKEINAAKKIAQSARSPLRVIKINLPWKGSALLDKKIKIPDRRRAKGIPSTYVPARNIIFLSFALSCAEAIGAQAIFIGAHAQDYSGYPDCRPDFYRAFKRVISSGTKAGCEKKKIRVETPLIHKSKAEIIRLGWRLGVPFELTWSCYRGGRRPCGECDSCYYRQKGFQEAQAAKRF